MSRNGLSNADLRGEVSLVNVFRAEGAPANAHPGGSR